jgi:DNA helicase-2/ATP-dependent DNA helicase PcrA
MSDWLKGLNPEQARAVMHNYGPLLILAGAGSGKTTVLVARTGRLISETIAPAHQICVLTFTNKAARELKHRVAVRVGPAAKGLWAGTFHSFGLQILRRFHQHLGLSSHFGVMDQSDCQAILRDLLKEVRNASKDRFDLETLLEKVNQRRLGKTPHHGVTDEYDEMAEWLFPRFVAKLKVLGVVDFEGLLLGPLQLFNEKPEILAKIQQEFSQVMVDEFQDTNELQMDLIRKLVLPHHNLSVVGDDDQSIYGWRGAEVRNILNFPHEFANCEVIKLERNYRSTPEILRIANAVIAKNQNRHGKVLRSDKNSNAEVLPEVFFLENEDEEADFVVSEIQHFMRMGFAHRDIAVLFRSNSQGALVESSLRRAQIPYAISGGSSIFDRKEVKDIMSYLQQAVAPNEVSLRRIINVPPRGIGDSTVEKIEQHAHEKKISFLQAFREPQEIDLPEKTQEALMDLNGYFQHFIQRLFARFDEIPNPADPAGGKVSQGPGERLLEMLMELGYKSYVQGSAAHAKSAENKWIVVEIFARVFESFLKKRRYDLPSVKEFLDAMNLRDDLTEEADHEKVQLMTLHASKGLEYPVVILIGVEEDLLPHKTLGLNIDEERRLFYVGVTRAKKHLVMSRCQQRKRHGAVRPMAPSRFMLEIPQGTYREFPLGSRPVTGQAREDLVSSFLAKLNSKNDLQK